MNSLKKGEAGFGAKDQVEFRLMSADWVDLWDLLFPV